ncbi:unnamed protein product, partial [Prorocentrum cordatum]
RCSGLMHKGCYLLLLIGVAADQVLVMQRFSLLQQVALMHQQDHQWDLFGDSVEVARPAAGWTRRPVADPGTTDPGAGMLFQGPRCPALRPPQGPAGPLETGGGRL